MKLLFLHCDYIRFKALKKALKSVDELSEKEKKEHEVKECLGVFVAIEKWDSVANVKELVANVKDVSSQVKAKNIVLYPYAHLSRNLSSPDVALEVLKKSEEELSKEFKVTRAPFGYYKEFELKVKGHPLSELSREIGNTPQASDSTTVKKLAKEEVYDHKQLLREISRSKLDTSKLKENDHRILGQQMDLFSFNEIAPGMVFWHNKGLIIYNELINFWREKHKKGGYEEIRTPQIMDSKLWKVSGHWDKYKDNNFITNYEGRNFLVKPMNCPGGMLVFKAGSKSYRDLPLRVGEMGTVHRTELSGVLNGLFRVIQFTQDDAHIFCADEEQAEEEVIGVAKFIKEFYEIFNLKFDHVELSTRPEKRIGSDEAWDKAEKMLEHALKKMKIEYAVNKGDGAFYGPKIDFHVKDSLGRNWQVSTIQLDFAMPERFNLEFADKDGKVKRPIILHRVIYGSLERFIGILLEHTNGNLPTWLAPIQARIINFTDRSNKYAEKILKSLKEEEIRVDSDFASVPLSGKIRNAELMKIPYIIVVGDKEEKDKSIAVRTKGEKKIKNMKLEAFVKDIKKEISERK